MIVVVTDIATIERAQAISQTLLLAGHTASPVIYTGTLRAEDLPADMNRLLAIDPKPDDLDTIKELDCPKACLYTALFDKAGSTDTADRHEASSIAHLWERPRSAIADRNYRPIILPAPVGTLSAAKEKFDAPPTRPIVGVMAPPLEVAEAIAVQEAYICLDRPKASLAIFNHPKILDNMTSKLAQTAGWFLPHCECGPIWSFEMTAVLLAGKTIACCKPPDVISPYVSNVRGLSAAIDIITTSDSAPPCPDQVRSKLAQNFIQTLEALGLTA